MIPTTKPITIGNATANETTVSLSLNATPTANGVTASAVVIGQRFVRLDSACIPVGSPIRKDISNVWALAESNPAIAEQVSIIQEALGKLAPLLEL